MAPNRQLIIWSVPSIAVLLGIFWIRRRKILAKSDPGGRDKIKCLQEELAEVLKAEVEAQRRKSSSCNEKIVAKSAPIDIIASGSNSSRSSPLELTDEEVEIEIEKIVQNKSLDKSCQSNQGNKLETAERYRGSIVRTSTEFSCMNICSPPEPKQSIKSDSDAIEAMKGTVILVSNESNHNNSNFELPCSSPKGSVEADNKKMAAIAERNNNNIEMEAIHVNTTETDCNNVSDKDNNGGDCLRRSSERDSANHSPVDPMLASPSMCQFSDSQSEGSSDSGKGCSEAASPPPAQTGSRSYQFVIPQTLVGLLIGRQGAFVAQVKSKTGASICVKRHPESTKTKICAIEGSQNEVEAALDMIRKKFPEKKFPNLSLQEIGAELLQRLFPITPEFMALPLVEVVNNETIMTCLVSAGHFFLQQPFHPTFPALHALHRAMAQHYHAPGAPSLPTPIKEGSICAAPTENNWYRAQVISSSAETETAVVKLVDFGGYLTVQNEKLKQIHADFMHVPFQATEVMLAYVKPAKDEWSEEALRIMAGLTAGQLLLAQVAGYNEDGVPQVALYLTLPQQEVVFLNAELVERGLAEWEPVEA